MLGGNQHGGREQDDLQNYLDMASHENPLYCPRQNTNFNLTNVGQYYFCCVAGVARRHMKLWAEMCSRGPGFFFFFFFFFYGLT